LVPRTLCRRYHGFCFFCHSKNCRNRSSFLVAEAGKFFGRALRITPGDGAALYTSGGEAVYPSGEAATPAGPAVTTASSVTPTRTSRFMSSFFVYPTGCLTLVSDSLKIQIWSHLQIWPHHGTNRSDDWRVLRWEIRPKTHTATDSGRLACETKILDRRTRYYRKLEIADANVLVLFGSRLA
jgi:hypothetical protein